MLVRLPLFVAFMAVACAGNPDSSGGGGSAGSGGASTSGRGGSAGGARAVEHLRLVMAEVQVATVRSQVMLSLSTDFENYSVFKPNPSHEKSLNGMLDQLVAWSAALQPLRKK